MHPCRPGLRGAVRPDQGKSQMHISSLRILAATCCLGSMVAHAADPASGTLSTANPTITYESGPFTGSNPEGECDDVFCDHFALTLDLAGVPTTSSVRITTSWITPADDFDIYWMNGAAEVDHSARSEEHTSELQSPCNLVCRLLLENKNKINIRD